MRGDQIAATWRDPHGCGHFSVSDYFLQEIGKKGVVRFLCVNLPRAAERVQRASESPPGRIKMVAS